MGIDAHRHRHRHQQRDLRSRFAAQEQGVERASGEIEVGPWPDSHQHSGIGVAHMIARCRGVNVPPERREANSRRNVFESSSPIQTSPVSNMQVTKSVDVLDSLEGPRHLGSIAGGRQDIRQASKY